VEDPTWRMVPSDKHADWRIERSDQ
jgi:hypothetical protein